MAGFPNSRHEGLRTIPRTRVKSQAYWHRGGRARQVLGALASPAYVVNPRPVGDTVFKKRKCLMVLGGLTRQIARLLPGLLLKHTEGSLSPK